MKLINIADASFQYHPTHSYLPFLEVENQFHDDDYVIVTEKLRTNQIVIAKDRKGNLLVSSKRLWDTGHAIPEFHSETVMEKFKRFAVGEEKPRAYLWQAARNSNILERLEQWTTTEAVIFGVLTPSFAPGYPYTNDPLEEPRVLVERIVVEGKDSRWHDYFAKWVPLFDYGKWDPEKQLPKACGMEEISGKKLHLRDGIVIRHVQQRYLPDGRPILAAVYPKDVEEWCAR